VATQSAAAKVEKDGPKLEDDFQAATHRFESYISHVKAYFEAEQNMIDFLKKRYLSIEMNIPLLVSFAQTQNENSRQLFHSF
jgi:hypothetical protein